LLYNAESDGGWRDEIKKIKRDSRYKMDNIFDNSVVIIDEVHNFTNGIVNLENKKRKSGEMTKVDLYNDIYRAKNAHVILMTGTPIFNKPVELAYLFNMVRGQLENRPNIRFPTDEREFNDLFLKDITLLC